MILVHYNEANPEIKKAREAAGLKYIDSILLEGKTPRDTCFYDNSKLEKLFTLSSGMEHKVCEKCCMSYQVPKE